MRTQLAILLDRSSSMGIGGKRRAAVSALNEFMAAQRHDSSDELLVTLTQFNTDVEITYKGVPVADVPDLDYYTYVPYGNTALFDAIVQTINATDTLVVADDRVLFVILTDGEENSSREATRDDVLRLIKEREGRGNWTFMYLSASPTAFADGASIGVGVANSYAFTDTAGGTKSAGMHLNSAVKAYRGSKGKSSSNMGDIMREAENKK